MDFRRSRTPATPLSIRGEMVEMIQEYKYMGFHLDSKLDQELCSSLQEGPESALFPAESPVLQRLRHHAADVL